MINTENLQLAGFNDSSGAIKEGMMERMGQRTGHESPKDLTYLAQQDALDQMRLYQNKFKLEAYQAMADGADERNKRDKHHNSFGLMG